MRLLWITNIKVECGDNETCRGGWMTGALDYLLDNTGYEIVIVYPNGEKNDDSGNSQIDYATFTYNIVTTKYDESICQQFINIYAEYQPDVIHIWGTEYLHSYAAVTAAEKMKLLDKVIISIQGLVSIYSNHYALGIPERYHGAGTLPDVIYGRTIKDRIRLFKQRGIYEQMALKKVHYVIGRTSWDKACVQQINPDVKYLFCNEIMRNPFYLSDKWELSKCVQHSIFISQATYPVKGFHFVVEAIKYVKNKFPNVRVYVAGGSAFDKKGETSFIKRCLQMSTYEKYLYREIYDNGLQENFCFLGQLSAVQMKEQYLKANVFVSASTIENSSNSIVEAMLLGVPVISSYVGGITDMIVHKKDGILYPCDEPYMLAYYIIEIFQDASMAEQISYNAREKTIKMHDRETIGKKMVSIYENIQLS